MQRAAGRLPAVSGGLIAVALGFSSRSWCITPGWGAAMPCAIWNPASCSGRSRCSVSSEGAEGSAAEPPTARRTRHSLQDTLASDGLRGGDGRYSELRASSRPTLPRPACKVGCSARCARPWHRKSSLPAPPIDRADGHCRHCGRWTAIFRSNQPDRRRQRSASEGAAGAPMADPPRAPWRGAAARAGRPALSASWRSSSAPMSRSRSQPEREPCARACAAPPSPAPAQKVDGVAA